MERHVPIAINRLTIDGAHAPHDHDYMEIVFVTGGTGMHMTASDKRSIQRGDVTILRPGSWHSCSDCRCLQIYVCCFGAELLRRELAWTLKDPELAYLFWAGPLSVGQQGHAALHLNSEPLDVCVSYLETLKGLEQEDTLHVHADRIGYLLLLFGQLARAIGEECRKPWKEENEVHWAVVQGVRLIEENPQRQWKLMELAGELNTAPSYLARLFKQNTGLPPMAYLARARAERAAQLLLRTDYPITWIAGEVGWHDPNYFSRRFRGHFGMSAKEYRRRFARPTSQQDGSIDECSAKLPRGF